MLSFPTRRSSDLHFHGGRRLPRVPRRPDAAGRGRPDGGALARIPLCVGNWKMQGTIAEGRALAAAICDGLKRPRGDVVVICPPSTALAPADEVRCGAARRLR